MVLVANKVDLVHLRKVNTEQGQEMAAKHNVSTRCPQILKSADVQSKTRVLQFMSAAKAVKRLSPPDGTFSLKKSKIETKKMFFSHHADRLQNGFDK